MERVHIKTEESRAGLPPAHAQGVLVGGAMNHGQVGANYGAPAGGGMGFGGLGSPGTLGMHGASGTPGAAETGNLREAGGVFPHLSKYQLNNSGGMADSSLQECLSPFFQPFGVDVSHFPLTNPPIFQSSLTNFSDHPRRRRISISNGQISQLGDATHTFDDLYYTQPPPMPIRHERQDAQPHIGESKSVPPQGAKAAPAPVQVQGAPTAQHFLPQQQAADVVPGQQHGQLQVPPQHAQHPQHPQHTQPVQHAQHAQHAQQPMDGPHQHAPVPDELYSKDSAFSSSFSTPTDASLLVPENSRPPVQALPKEYQVRPRTTYEDGPGTPEWKRARLLERNRIAASKCRQRKKIAQQQLQKDVSQLTQENRFMRKKLDYYEKLVNKFKKFTEIHMASCGGSEQLSVIEDLLKIDHNIDDKQGGFSQSTEEEARL